MYGNDSFLTHKKTMSVLQFTTKCASQANGRVRTRSVGPSACRLPTMRREQCVPSNQHDVRQNVEFGIRHEPEFKPSKNKLKEPNTKFKLDCDMHCASLFECLVCAASASVAILNFTRLYDCLIAASRRPIG
eukprot:TRINITY_DN23604_c0_g2_i1.p1 TRINITY_DN23604_c0_g2~~TRINITY_DN23604_c0_g2_i1.p1  ORF type:complete len:132 (+),score=5.63 TRINITY_DN23604_c0_g2_i1:76-471(+)